MPDHPPRPRAKAAGQPRSEVLRRKLDCCVGEVLARQLAGAHPGTSWTFSDGSGEAAPGAVVLKLPGPEKVHGVGTGATG